jgi:hypothetical protein
MSNVSPQWDGFANWLLTDEATRDRQNLPKSQAEYALATKVSDRQLRRWKADPMFKALLEKKAGKSRGLAAVSVDGVPAVLEASEEELAGNPEDDYQAIKGQLVKGAITGDPKYLDLYFKTYGKEFVAEEIAARTSDLAGLELDDLIREAASVLDERGLVAYLRSKGYTINQPGSGHSDESADIPGDGDVD